MRHLIHISIFVSITSIISCVPSLSQPVFEVRYIGKTKHAGAALLHLEGSTTSYYVGGYVLGVSDADSASARSNRTTSGQDAHSVTVYLKKDLKERWQRFTERNIQNRIAILVDGKLRAAPLILAAFRDPIVFLPVTSEAEARDIAKRITEAARARTQ